MRRTTCEPAFDQRKNAISTCLRAETMLDGSLRVFRFWVENRKCSGSNRQIAKPRRPARVKVSSFDAVATSGTRKSIGKRLIFLTVGLDGPKFRIFDGFQEILGLTPVMGLPISGIIINTQVMFPNAWVTCLDVNF